jgi:hypothetical protein
VWKRILALAFIFFCTSAAWVFLGGTTHTRTFRQDVKLRNAVGRLWGTVERQQAPEVYYVTSEKKKVKRPVGNKLVTETVVETTRHPLILAGSDIAVDLKLDHRKKGLLWYSTYRVSFSAKYRVENGTDEPREVFFEYSFPTQESIYDDFSLVVDGKRITELKPEKGKIRQTLPVPAGETKEVAVAYESQGLDQWWYIFGREVSQIRNFKLTMTTDFDDIDFPENSISPTTKLRASKGWRLIWEYSNLISGIQIGMDLPQKLNPGPLVSKVSFFAPVSLFFFFFMMFIITTIKSIRIHPMNYFFVAAAFFSFHLLFAYLVDHIDVHLAFVICSAVSIFLVVSYMRLVVGKRFAFVETGVSQFVYLVLFSYSFFLEGYTGLSITIASIVTLFVVMQLTGRIDWAKHLAPERRPST